MASSAAARIIIAHNRGVASSSSSSSSPSPRAGVSGSSSRRPVGFAERPVHARVCRSLHATGRRQRLCGRPCAATAADQSGGWWQQLVEWFGDDGGDPGHWNFSPEWWGNQGGDWGKDEGRVVFDRQSKLNGKVTVTSHDASPVAQEAEAEAEEGPGATAAGPKEEWRVLRFNDLTRQSAARVVVGPGGELKQRPECLAQEYLKSNVSAMASVLGLNYGREVPDNLRVLCIGVGGGSLPLFVAHHFPSASVEGVEVDPVVLEAAEESMGLQPLPNLQIHTDDGLEFLQRHIESGSEPYDLIFIDAFDGTDETPATVIGFEFAKALTVALEPTKGALVMNVHGTKEIGPAEGYYGAMKAKCKEDGGGAEAVCYTVDCTGQPNTTLVIAYGLDLPADPDIAGPVVGEAAIGVAEEAGFPFRVRRRAGHKYRRMLLLGDGSVMYLI